MKTLSFKYKKVGYLILVIGLFMAAFRIGFAVKKWYYDRTVAIRAGITTEFLDYDMQVAIRFLEHELKKAGYFVLGTSFQQNLYPEEMNKARINIFVRGFMVFFDKRMSEDNVNAFYLHRNTGFHHEEMRNFDYYLASQKKILYALGKDVQSIYVPVNFLKHKLLLPKDDEYAYDVLYIYEYDKFEYRVFLNQYIPNHKIYSGMEFADLSIKEQENELKKAKLVVYAYDKDDKDDDNYVPYAVYDIISYGRPVLVRYNETLENITQKNVYFYHDDEDKMRVSHRAVNEAITKREAKAQKARELLFEYKNQQKLTDFEEDLKKLIKK